MTLCLDRHETRVQDTTVCLFCTLARHHEGDHYDVYFSRGWSDDPAPLD